VLVSSFSGLCPLSPESSESGGVGNVLAGSPSTFTMLFSLDLRIAFEEPVNANPLRVGIEDPCGTDIDGGPSLGGNAGGTSDRLECVLRPSEDDGTRRVEGELRGCEGREESIASL